MCKPSLFTLQTQRKFKTKRTVNLKIEANFRRGKADASQTQYFNFFEKKSLMWKAGVLPSFGEEL